MEIQERTRQGLGGRPRYAASAVGSALSSAIESGADYVAIPADVSDSPFPLARTARFGAIVSAWMRLPRRGRAVRGTTSPPTTRCG